MKRIIMLVGILLIFTTSLAIAQNIEEVKLTSLPFVGERTLAVITEDNFTFSWKKNDKVEKYVVTWDANSYELAEGATSFKKKDLEYGSYDFLINGYDSENKIIARSKIYEVVRVDKTIKDLKIQSPADKSLILAADEWIKWNFILGADNYRIAFYHDEELIREENIYSNVSFIPDIILMDELRQIKLEVQALRNGEVISSDSVMIKVSSNGIYGYASELVGLSYGDVLLSNRINCQYRDNSYEDLYYNFKIIDMENNEVASDIYDINFGDRIKNRGIRPIRALLKDGNYKLEITAFKLTEYPMDYIPLKSGNKDEIIKANMKAARNKVEYNKEVISFEVRGDSDSKLTPSAWAKNYVDKIYNWIPLSLDSGYQSYITREESCDLLIPFYENTIEFYHIFRASEFNDTKNVNVNKAKRLGIISGEEKEFLPHKEISREEFCVMVLNMIKAMRHEIELEYSKEFKDHDDISAWARGAVYFLYDNGIVTGRENNIFNPKGFITREEGMVIFSRLVDYHYSIAKE